MSVNYIVMDINAIKADNNRLKIENARLVTYLREARDLIQRFEKGTRPHSAPRELPSRDRLFSHGSVSPQSNSFLRKYMEEAGRRGSD